MTQRQAEIVERNLNAFKANFGSVRIETFGREHYVFCPADDTSWVQYCPTTEYLDGWLYGCVQGALGRVKLTEERRKEFGYDK